MISGISRPLSSMTWTLAAGGRSLLSRAFASSAAAASAPAAHHHHHRFGAPESTAEVVVQDDVDENGESTGVKIITLNRPTKLNALTESMGAAFTAAIDGLAALPTDELRAVVLTGAGKAFSAGGDLDFLVARSKSTPFDNTVTMERFYRLFLSVRRLPVPVISAINGPAIGAGLCLALATDIRLAADDAKLGLTFVGLGLHPGMAATHFLPRLVPAQSASYLLLTGDVVSGTRARDLGLVLDLHARDRVLPEAIRMARHVADQGPIAVRTCLQSLRGQLDDSLTASLTREASAQASCYASEDLRSRVQAMKDRTSKA